MDAEFAVLWLAMAVLLLILAFTGDRWGDKPTLGHYLHYAFFTLQGEAGLVTSKSCLPGS